MNKRMYPRRRWKLAAVAALATAGTVAAIPTEHASAALSLGLIPTTTTVTASPSSSPATPVPYGQSVTFTASVANNPAGGLVVLPNGNVNFSFVSNNTQVPLGSPAITCGLFACTATLTTKLPPGTVTVTAAYGGDLVEKPSAGTVSVTTAQPPMSPDTEQDGCAWGFHCSLTQFGGNGNQYFDLYSPNDGSSYNADLQFVPAGLSCDNLTLGVSDAQFQLLPPPPSSEKLASMSFTGTVANSLSSEYGNWYAPGLADPTAMPASPICYQSPEEFTTFGGSPAPYDPNTQSFTGLLPGCSSVNPSTYNGQVAPCIEDFYTGDGFYEIDMALQANDPLLGVH